MRVTTVFRWAVLLGGFLAFVRPGLASPTPIPIAPPRPPVIAPPPAASGARPAASTGAVYSGMTVAQVAEILTRDGYRADVLTTSEGQPMIGSAAGGVKFALLFYGCDSAGAKACRVVQFVAGWGNDLKLTAEDVNACNDQTVFGKLVASPEHLVLSHASSLGGVSDPFVTEQLEIWNGVLSGAAKCFGAKAHAGAGSKSGAAPLAQMAPPAPGASDQTSNSLASSALPPAALNATPH